MFTVVPGDGSGHEGRKDGSPSLIDEIVREGARRMLAEALQAEVDAYIAAFAAERDEDGRRLVVRLAGRLHKAWFAHPFRLWYLISCGLRPVLRGRWRRRTEPCAGLGRPAVAADDEP
jgi:hypothetical protein